MKKKIKIDGINPCEMAKVRSAIRQVWQRSYSRNLVKKRCQCEEDKEYSKCEKCFKVVPKVYIDHIEKVGDILNGGLSRLFVPSKLLQGLCKACHDAKTKQEKKDEKIRQLAINW